MRRIYSILGLLFVALVISYGLVLISHAQTTTDEVSLDASSTLDVFTGGEVLTPEPLVLDSGTTLLTNLEGYWKLDESSGNAIDSSGNSHTGVNTNVTYTSGQINNSASFNGSSAKLALDSSLLSGSGFTIAGWINFTSTGGILGSANGGVAFKTGGSPVKLYLEVAGTAAIGNSATTITSGWKYVAVTYDSSGAYKFYLNGTLDGSGTNLQSFSAQNKYLGLNGTTEWFNGKIDEIGVWSRVLSGSEIGELYNGGVGLSYPFGVSTSTPASTSTPITDYSTDFGLAIIITLLFIFICGMMFNYMTNKKEPINEKLK